MPQARILEPVDHPAAHLFVACGFRWCKKDGRWERNTKDPQQAVNEVIAKHPVQLKVEIKQ